MARKQHVPETADHTSETPDQPLPIVQGAPVTPQEINPYVSDVNDVPLVKPPAVGTAMQAGDAAAQPPKRNRWRVTATMPAMIGGIRTMLRYGKIVDDVNYNIKQLQAQGIPLEAME